LKVLDFLESWQGLRPRKEPVQCSWVEQSVVVQGLLLLRDEEIEAAVMPQTGGGSGSS